MSKQELTAEFDWERAVFQDNTPERTIIGITLDDITLKGRAQPGQLEYGLTYRFTGRWQTHDKYGRQFHFDSFTLSTPNGERGTVKYLARARGIGRAIAQQIWNLYGADSLEVCRTDPQRIAAEVKGLTLEKAEAAAVDFKSWQALEQVTIAVTELLAGRGFPRALTQQVIGKWGAEAAEVIRDTPYSLLIFPGVGFLTADKLYLELGHPPDAIERQALCAWYALHSDTQGHTWHDLSVCEDAIRQSVGGTRLDVAAAMKQAYGEDRIRRREIDGRTYVAEARKADSESLLAGYLHEALSELDDDLGFPDYSQLQWPDVDEIDGLFDEQNQELWKALAGVLGVLAGSPGCGKTTTLAMLIRAILARRGHGQIAVCAPTGKAAVRITESLAEKGVSIKAMTIHRLLQVQSAGDGGWSFVYNESNKLPHQFIFVDESSMVDCDLMRALLAARKRGCHVLFVGDPDQLAPVGHGAPFRDMIASGVPSGHLKEIHRNAGRIVKACAEIRDRPHRFNPSPHLDLDNGENLIVSERLGARTQIGTIKQLLDQSAVRFGVDPVWNVQVLVPLNETSEIARKPLNRELQAHLNPNGQRIPGNPFRVSDKIICTSNGRLPAGPDCPRGETDEDGKVYVANGEHAKVLEVHPAKTIVELSSPRRVVLIPKGQAKDEDDTACNWELGYAISAHKSQGSEWPITIVVIDEAGGAKWVCTREWMITALSRAKMFCVCVGRRVTAEGFCLRSGLWERRTLLVEKLKELDCIQEGALS